jgi:hypothetical protein
MPTVVSSMVSNVRTSVEARGFNGYGPVALYLAVKEYLKDRNAFVSPSLLRSIRQLRRMDTKLTSLPVGP